METSQERLRDADVNIDRKWARAHFLGVAVFPAVNSGLSDAACTPYLESACVDNLSRE